MAIYTLSWDDEPAAGCRGSALSIGNFDGVHRGHQALVRALREKASANDIPAVLLTFDPHPLELLRPQQFQPLLTTALDRAALLEAHGADHVIILRTTPALLRLTAEEFFEQVIHRRLDARVLVEGINFGFGRGREGDVETLRELSQRAGIDPPVVVPPFLLDGLPVSSSRVRSALVQGDVHAAAALLDRPYRIRGTVGVGQRRGRTLGFPTANLEHVPTLIPGDGVYAVWVTRGNARWRGAANVGPNPTFGEHARKVEVHLLDFQGDLYREPLAVDFVDRIRDTRPFAGPAELIAQLRRDVDQARRLAAG
jgi:riboflavin kinase/FMN adenylyltransferase